MKRMHLWPLSLVLLAGLTLSGCGQSETPPSTPPPAPQAESKSAPTPAATPAPSSAERVAEGKKLFQQTCAACHGMEGQGMPNLGKDMTKSEFIKSQSDDELLTFIKKGRMPSDPMNTTGVAMPPKGGNPALSDAQLQVIIAYIRSL